MINPIDPVKTILEGHCYYQEKYRLELREHLSNISNQDTLKLLMLVPHTDDYVIEEEVSRFITDEDFLRSLYRNKFKLSRKSSSTSSVCERRIHNLMFIKQHDLKYQMQVNLTSHDTNEENAFRHYLSKIEETDLKSFSTDKGGFWMLRLSSSHYNHTEHLAYLKEYGLFIRQHFQSCEHVQDEILGRNPLEAFNKFIDIYNKKDKSYFDSGKYKLTLSEVSSKHYIMSE